MHNYLNYFHITFMFLHRCDEVLDLIFPVDKIDLNIWVFCL